jgi:hypothetical protein
MEDRKIPVIDDWLVLASTAQPRLFMGFAGCYRNFVHKFAYRIIQLYALTAVTSAL